MEPVHSILDCQQMRALYRHAKDVETPEESQAYSGRFWFPRLVHDFPFNDNWAVLPAERKPFGEYDDLREMPDMHINFFNETQFTHSTVVMLRVEGEGSKNVTQSVEDGALQRAKDIIQKSGQSPELLVMTCIGPSFRAWRCNREAEELLPLFGGAKGSKTEYLDAETEQASVEYAALVKLAKASVNMPQASTVPP